LSVFFCVRIAALGVLMKVPPLLLRFISRLNLWTRLVIGLTVGFALLFGVFSLVSLRVLDDSTQRILTERGVIAQMAARRYDELLTQEFYELDNTTTFAAFDPQAGDLSSEKHMLAQVYGAQTGFSLAVVFLDARGRVVLIQPDDGRTAGADYSIFPFVAETVKSGQRNISNPFWDPRTGKAAVALTIPILDRGGHLMSMLSGWIDLSSPLMLNTVEQARNLGNTGHAELVDSRGVVIASTESESSALASSGHLHFYLRMLSANRGGVDNVLEESGPHQGEMHVMAFAPLTVAHWGIAVGGTEAETFAPVRELQTVIFLFGTFSFAIIFLATLVGARLLVHPVKVLTDAAQQIASGNLDNSIQLSEGGEIGALAKAFETMRVQLQHSLAEIRAWSDELEARVKDRTQALESLNTQLQHEQDERQQLLKHVITAQEEERKRVARELHDETGQGLAAVLMSLEAVENNLTPDTPAPLRAQLSRTRALTEHSLRDLRTLIRDLRPTALDDLGLIPAIRWYAENHLEPHGINVTVTATRWNGRLPPPIETVLFRMMQEAVNNIARHSTAHNVKISLVADDGGCHARVEDDGQGFTRGTARSSEEGGWGLVGMRERAALIHGKVQIESAPGAGTRVLIDVPCQENGE
jgi:signal transduction histidine kinase